MIKKVEIENYKSLENLSIELGRFNVFIGENGCGKTNILESLILAAAGMHGKFDSDFVPLRGGRMNEAKFFKSGYEEENISNPIKINFFDTDQNKVELRFNNDNEPFSKWKINIIINDGKEFRNWFQEYINFKIKQNSLISSANNDPDNDIITKDALLDKILADAAQEMLLPKAKIIDKEMQTSDYLIYAPENFFLRNESINLPYVEPVGYRGEGLIKLIKIIKRERSNQYKQIIDNLHLIDWFEGLLVEDDPNIESDFILTDKYLEDGLKSFDIRNANEGFLFVLFYLTIFISDYTPKFFAIDNIDTALNPKLCSKLITILIELAKKHDKQVLITTHNPSVLDGLNLNDDEQRLFVVARNKAGRTRATRIEHKPSVNGTTPVKLSEQFLRGYIGGLPKNF